MTIVEFQINKSKYQIECPEDEKSKILELAKKLNKRTEKLAKHFAKIDEKTLLAICCLTMQDEIETKQQPSGENADETAKNLEKITSQIDSLAKKIENY